MSASEDEDKRSANNLNIDESKPNLCNLCNKKVVDSINCIKCNAMLHRSCWNKCKKSSSAICVHVSSMEESSCESISTPITENNFENEFLKMQVKLLNELLVEMKSKNLVLMKNNELLIEKIKFLENDNHSPKKRKQDPINKPTLSVRIQKTDVDKSSITSPSVSVSELTSSSNVNINNNGGRNENNDYKVEENEQLWSTVVSKKHNKSQPRINVSADKQVTAETFKYKQRKMIECTRAPNTNAKVRGAIRRKWIYVGRISGANISEDDIKDYMADLQAGGGIEVRKLPTKGENSAFSIGIPDDSTYNKLNSPDFWPQGVILREFNFKNFFRKPQERKEG